jgi:hypothetical protein
MMERKTPILENGQIKMEIKKLLLKYDLEDPIILLENPVKTEEWKRTVTKAINFKWKTLLLVY